jgi:hypothetical protein
MFRKFSIDIRNVTPEAMIVTCTVPQEQRVTRRLLLETSSVWGPQLLAGIGGNPRRAL